jgi:hypothetical protein
MWRRGSGKPPLHPTSQPNIRSARAPLRCYRRPVPSQRPHPRSALPCATASTAALPCPATSPRRIGAQTRYASAPPRACPTPSPLQHTFIAPSPCVASPQLPSWTRRSSMPARARDPHRGPPSRIILVISSIEMCDPLHNLRKKCADYFFIVIHI